MDGALTSSRTDSTNNNSSSSSGNPSWNPPSGDFHSGRPPSSRGGYNRGGYHNNRRGGGRGGGGRRNNNRGGGRYDHRRPRGGGGGRGGRHNRHHHGGHHQGHHDRGGGGGGNRGNRAHYNNNDTSSIDPEKAMLAQLSAMVAKLGDLTDSSGSSGGGNTNEQAQGDGENSMVVTVRPDVGKNARELGEVLCANNAELFLKFAKKPNDDDDDDDDDKADEVNMNEEEENIGDTKSKVKTVSAEEMAGPTATLVVNCASTLPLQTSGYVALTAAIESRAPSSHKGFAKRCVTLACQRIELDYLLLLGSSSNSNHTEEKGSSLVNVDKDGKELSVGDSDPYKTVYDVCESKAEAFHRIKLLLRYLALLSKIGICRLLPANDETDTQEEEEEGGIAKTSFLDLIESLSNQALTCARKAQKTSSTMEEDENESFLNVGHQNDDEDASSNANSTIQNTAAFKAVTSNGHKMNSLLLSYLVLSTLPYVCSSLTGSSTLGVDHDVESWKEQVLERCSAVVHSLTDMLHGKSMRRSMYEPGWGMLALYLAKEELDTTPSDDDNHADDDDDDDDDDDNDSSDDEDQGEPKCCDTLFELLRVNRRLVKCGWEISTNVIRDDPVKDDDDEDEEEEEGEIIACGAPGFAIFSDAPWEGLLPSITSDASMEDDDDDDDNEDEENDTKPTNETPFEPFCLPIQMQTHGTLVYMSPLNPPTTTTTITSEEQMMLQSLTSSTLPASIISGRFPILDDPDTTPRDARIMLQTLTPTDQYFYGECIREILFCNLPTLTPGGGDKTTSKDVANQISSLSLLFPQNSHGEYVAMSVLLTLIAQSDLAGSAYGKGMSRIYLGRVLLELCKLRPDTFPKVLAESVGLIVGGGDTGELGGLVPGARRTLAEWFAFHLINTDFQWPYWSHWDKYANSSSHFPSARTAFLSTTLQACAESFSPEYIASQCLPPDSPLVARLPNGGHTGHFSSEFLSQEMEEEESSGDAMSFTATIQEIKQKISQKERPTDVACWLCDDSRNEVAKSTTNIMWRTTASIHAILSSSTETQQQPQGNTNIDPDILSETIDTLTRYTPLLLSSMDRDVDVANERASANLYSRQDAEIMLLSEIHSVWKSDGGMVCATIDFVTRAEHGVSMMALMKWVLKDVLPGNEGGEDGPYLWRLARSCMQHFVSNSVSKSIIEKEQSGKDEDTGMIVDGEAGRALQSEEGDDDDDTSNTKHKSSSPRLEKAIQTLDDILLYTIKRVAFLLQHKSSEEKDLTTITKKSNGKISPRNVSLMEGLKEIILDVQCHTLAISFAALPLCTSSTASCAMLGSIANCTSGQMLATKLRAEKKEEDEDEEEGIMTGGKELIESIAKCLGSGIGGLVVP